VEELHIKLSKPDDGRPVRDEAMDTSSSSLVHNYYTLVTIDIIIMLTVAGEKLRLLIEHCMLVCRGIDDKLMIFHWPGFVLYTELYF
jgi:hypothetical protein